MRMMAVVAGAFLLSACGTKAPEPAQAKSGEAPAERSASSVSLSPAMQNDAGIRTMQVDMRSVPQAIRATARVTNDEIRSWRVGAITEGRIVTVLVNPGDRIREGQVLARMHSHDIHESRAEYQKAKSELTRLKMTEAFALRVRDRAKRLLELKAGSVEQYEHAETELKNAEAAVESAEVEVNRTRLHLVEFLGIPADAPPSHTAAEHDDAKEFIPVRAPASGTLLARNVTPGTVVTQSMDLFVISDLARLWAIAEVNEEHLSKLRAGMPARLYVQAYGERAFAGRIGRIGEALDPETHTVRVRLDVPNPSGALKPEMYATAEIEIGGSDPALFVEPEALQEVRGATVVFVQREDGRFEVRPVQVGRTVSGMAEIVRGLNAGDRVVVRGAFIIKSEFLKASLADE
jgi:membrane fusion protein, heavy metal efflux system